MWGVNLSVGRLGKTVFAGFLSRPGDGAGFMPSHYGNDPDGDKMNQLSFASMPHCAGRPLMPEDPPNISLTTPLRLMPGIGPNRAAKLARLGLRTAQDVLFLFPRDYEFPAPTTAVDDLREGQPASLVGTITDAEITSRSPGKSVFAAIVTNNTGTVRMLFFNQPFRAEQLTFDRKVMISGQPKLNGLRMEFVHPKVVALDETGGDPMTPTILPIYPLTESIKQSDLRRLTRHALDVLTDQIAEVMPASLRADAAAQLRHADLTTADVLPDIVQSLNNLHAPSDEESLTLARLRLVFQEVLVMQLALAMRRRRLTTDLRAPSLTTSAMIDARITNRFPFELTSDQKRVIAEIANDLGKQFPMNRLLQGDVGSGKNDCRHLRHDAGRCQRPSSGTDGADRSSRTTALRDS